MYAERKNIPLRGLQIVLSHRRESEKNRSGSATGDERIDMIDGEISMSGELDDAQRERLLQIANRCWMHRTLSRGVKIHLSQGKPEHANETRKATAETRSFDVLSHRSQGRLHRRAYPARLPARRKNGRGRKDASPGGLIRGSKRLSPRSWLRSACREQPSSDNRPFFPDNQERL